MDLNDFAVDPAKEVEGVWVPCGDAELKLGRINSNTYFDYLGTLREPHIKAVRRGQELAKDVAEGMYNRALSEKVLLGWKNLKINGKPIDYSKDMAYKILSDKRLVMFRSKVVELAGELSRFALDNYEELEGNLLSSSGSTVQ